MKKLLAIICLTGALNSYSQTKVKLANTPIDNQALPQDFTNRVFWNQTDLFKFNLDQLTGSIIYTEGTKDIFARGPRVIDSKTPLQIKTIQNGLRYHSKVDKGFSADLKAFIFSGEISDKQVVDIKITDLLYVFIDYEKVPVDSIIKAAKVIKPGEKKYYIQGALLTSIDQQHNNEVSNKGSLIGSAFGANGKVYNDSEKFSQDFRISLTLIDIDKLIFFQGSKNLSNVDEYKESIEASILRKSLIVNLNGF